MTAEEYSTKNAKGKEDIFDLYHAFEAGERKGKEAKTFPLFVMGIFVGIAVGFLIVDVYTKLKP